MLGTSYLHEKRLILQERIWATTWFYASVLSRGTIALNWASEKNCAAAQLSAIVLCRGIIANSKAKTHSIEKLGLKGAKIRGSWLFITSGAYWGALWCARAWILVEIKLEIEVWKRFWLHTSVLLLHFPSFTLVQCLWLVLCIFLWDSWTWVAKHFVLGLFWTLVWIKSWFFLSFCD